MVQVVSLPDHPDWMKAVAFTKTLVKISDESDKHEFPSITVWTEDNYGDCDSTVRLSETGGLDAFIENQCEDCKFYFDEEDYEDEDGTGCRITGTRYSCCDMQRSNNTSWPCPEGLSGPSDDEDVINLPPMRFNQALTTFAESGSKEPYKNERCTTFFQKFEIKEDGAYVTNPLTVINGYADGTVCWGKPDHPQVLCDAMNEYATSDFNEDLQTLSCMEERIDDTRKSSPDIRIADTQIIWHHEQPEEERPDAIAYIEPLLNPSTWLILAASGVYFDELHIILPLRLFHYQNEAYYHTLGSAKTLGSKTFLFSINGLFLGLAPEEITTILNLDQPVLAHV